MHDAEDVRRLLDGLRGVAGNNLAGLQRTLLDVVTALNHELKHETAHLATLAVLCGVVPQDSDILGALQQTVEIVGIDAYLVFDGGKLVGLTDAVRDE